MGIHICVYGPDGGDHPDWDWIRYAGDRDFPSVISGLPAKELYGRVFRPADFKIWREAIAKVDWPNPGRFEGLMDLLEKNPKYGIYFSW